MTTDWNTSRAITLDEVVDAVDLQLHPDTRRDVPQTERSSALQEELEWAVVTATTDLEFARDYHRRMPHSGTTAADYLNRWVTIAPDLQALLGPRHRARDLSRPFIAVDAASRRIRAEDIPALQEAGRQEFSTFHPRSVVFWDRAGPAEWPDAGVDMRLLAGRAAAMRGRAIPADLTIAAAPDMSFYDGYAAGYDDLLDRRPEAREWTQRTPFADLEALQHEGLVLDATVDGRWAGLIAGRPGTRAGLRGLEVVEIFLTPDRRGRGFGAALSTALARHESLSETDFVFGTIHAENRAARAAALSAGRADLGGEVVIPLETVRD